MELKSGFFKINGVSMPSPDLPLSVQIEDISSSDSGRSIDGTMNKDIVAVKRTLAPTWTRLKQSDMQALVTALKQAVYIEVTYPDPQYGIKTITVYVGNIKPTLSAIDGVECYWDLSQNLIER